MASSFDFPYRKPNQIIPPGFPQSESDGEVDWHTLGNILTGELLGQVHCASFLDRRYGQKKQKEIVPDTKWEYTGTRHDIVILKKTVEGVPTDSFMGRIVVNFPVQVVAQLLTDKAHEMQWREKHLIDIRTIKILSQDQSDTLEYRCYQSDDKCHFNSKVEVVYYSRAKYHDEKFVLSAVSVGDTFYPLSQGILRAQMLPGTGFVLEPHQEDSNKTLVTLVIAVMISEVPAVAANKALKSLILNLRYFNDHLRKSSVHFSAAAMVFDPMNSISEYQTSYSEKSSSILKTELQVQGATAIVRSTEIDNEVTKKVHGKSMYKDGQVDWGVLGLEATKHILEEVEQFTAAGTKHGNGHRLSQNKTEWRFVHEKHGVLVYNKKQNNSSVDCFLGRGVVNAPMQQVGDFTANILSTYTWDNTLVDAHCVKIIKNTDNMTDYIGYQRYEPAKCMVHAKRDNLYFVRCIYMDGKYVQAAISVDHPDYPPPQGTTRIKVHSGSGWVMEPYNEDGTQTLVTYLAHVDLIGLPSIIANFVLRRHPLAIHYVRLQMPLCIQPLDSTASPHHIKSQCGAREDEALLTEVLDSPEEGWIITGWD